MNYKLFIFSDVHGCYDCLINDLEKSGFDINDDSCILVSCGDFFDRGLQSKEVYLFIQDMTDKGRFFGINGNHDQMLLDFLEKPELFERHTFNMYYNGTARTLNSLLAREMMNEDYSIIGFQMLRKRIKELYPRLVDFLDKVLVDEIIIDDRYVLTHAGYSFDENKDIWYPNNWCQTMLEFIDVYPVMEDKVFIFGHSWAAKLNQAFFKEYRNIDLNNAGNDMNIFRYKNYIGIDARTIVTKRVTVLVFETDSLNNIKTKRLP